MRTNLTLAGIKFSVKKLESVTIYNGSENSNEEPKEITEIEVNGFSTYNLTLKFNVEEDMLPLFVIGFTARSLSSEKAEKVKSKIINANPYRNCKQSDKSRKAPADSEKTSTRFSYWFLCDSESINDQKLKNITNFLKFEIKSTDNEKLDLFGFTIDLIKAYKEGNNTKCGKPEVPIGLRSKTISEMSEYSFDCSQEFNRVNGLENEVFKFKCQSDMKYSGNLPQCTPNFSCELFQKSTKDSAEVSAYENVYFKNQTYWLPIEGTKAHFKCSTKTNTRDIKEIRICGKFGKWNDNGPHCSSNYNGMNSRLSLAFIYFLQNENNK